VPLKPVKSVILLVTAWLSIPACARLLTTAPEPGDVFDGPVDGLSPEELAAFARGDEQFGRPFGPSEGLGPIFNNVSCASCHSGDGRGRPENGLTRFSGANGAAVPELGGPQLQDRAIPGAEPEQLTAGVQTSRRLPPPVFGMGLLEAVPVDTILARADANDVDGDGISGRAHFVVPPAFVPPNEPGGGALALGRFSRKAQVSSLLQQVVKAYHEDMGITSPFESSENANPLASVPTISADRAADPEVAEAELRLVIHYVRTLAPPAAGAMTPQRARGEQQFLAIGCAGCHVPTLHTGPATIPALAHREVPLFSDLLLHDTGEGLADHRVDGDADGREWRTAPLWGLRLMSRFLNGQAFLLHDGRARSVEEAVLLHGGEAQAARDAFAALSSAERAALLDFAGSR
jgi:CxxC motif-containing protein (DUF1111 family)